MILPFMINQVIPQTPTGALENNVNKTLNFKFLLHEGW